MNERQWYYAKAGVRIGPVTFEFLQELALKMHLSETDLVWSEPLYDWLRADSIVGLFNRTPDSAPPPLPPGEAATNSSACETKVSRVEDAGNSISKNDGSTIVSESESLFASAREFFFHKRYLDAIIACQRLTRKDANYFEGQLLIGRCYYETGDYFRAIVTFETLLTSTVATEIYKWLIECYFAIDNEQQALGIAEPIYGIDPHCVVGLWFAASKDLEAREYEAGIEKCSKAIEVDSEWARLYFMRAQLNLLRDSPSESNLSACVSDATIAINLEPDYANAFFIRGKAYASLNILAAARHDLKASTRYKPTFLQARLELARLYEQSGDLVNSASVYDQIEISLLRPNPFDLLDYLRVLYKMRRYVDAVPIFVMLFQGSCDTSSYTGLDTLVSGRSILSYELASHLVDDFRKCPIAFLCKLPYESSARICKYCGEIVPVNDLGGDLNRPCEDCGNDDVAKTPLLRYSDSERRYHGKSFKRVAASQTRLSTAAVVRNLQRAGLAAWRDGERIKLRTLDRKILSLQINDYPTLIDVIDRFRSESCDYLKQNRFSSY